jgi:PAP2 superfamily
MAAVASPPSPSSVVRLRISPRARVQIGLFLIAYLLYSAGRWLSAGDLPGARAHALWILHLERHLGVADEAEVQDALTGSAVLWALNHLYLMAQLVVVPGALVWLYRRSRPLYERLRNTILATWLIALPVYALFPVAPPRLAGIGMVDTITSQTGFAMDSKMTTVFYNELAAVPSLHVGFAVAVGLAVAAALRHPAAKALALLWGPAIALAVVATGNHFVFDIAAGVLVSAAGYVLGAVLVPALRRGWRPALPAPRLGRTPALPCEG